MMEWHSIVLIGISLMISNTGPFAVLNCLSCLHISGFHCDIVITPLIMLEHLLQLCWSLLYNQEMNTQACSPKHRRFKKTLKMAWLGGLGKWLTPQSAYHTSVTILVWCPEPAQKSRQGGTHLESRCLGGTEGQIAMTCWPASLAQSVSFRLAGDLVSKKHSKPCL